MRKASRKVLTFLTCRTAESNGFLVADSNGFLVAESNGFLVAESNGFLVPRQTARSFARCGIE